jgi:glutamine synthetase type III
MARYHAEVMFRLRLAVETEAQDVADAACKRIVPLAVQYAAERATSSSA